MAWLGLIGGIVIGGLIWEWNGAVVLGFFGWLAGIVYGSRKQPQAGSAVNAPPAPKPVESPGNRIDRLERTVAALESRIARLEAGGVAPVAAKAAAPAGAPMIATEDLPRAEPVVPQPVVEPVPAAAPEAAVPPPIPVEPTPPPPPRPPAPPPKPNPIIAWFTGGNTIVRVGVVVLFFGLVFLLNWAREHQLIPAELRVAGVAIVGIVLLVLGWRLRKSREGYAVSLQGAGVAVLYLTVFASMYLYGLISPGAAFVLLAAIAVFSGVMALAQDSLALAIFGASGGFLAPILASTGSGNHIALFSYYLILTLGVVLIAWFKAWRSLNILSFVFTVFVAFAWSERHYRDDLFPSCELFLVAFFVLYLAIAILFARSQVKGTGRFVDGTITFGNPLVAFTLQAGMLHQTEFGLAYTSLAAAFIYLVLAWVLHQRRSERWALLAQSFLALGVVFATLAIPLALDARWTSASWALEGAAIVWIGVRQKHTIARAFGLLLQLAAGVAYLGGYSRFPGAEIPLVDAPFIGALLLAGAGLWTHRLLALNAEVVTKVERAIVPVAFLWGLVWLLFAGHHEIETWIALRARGNAHVAFFALTALAFAWAGRRWEWKEARWPGLALVPVLCISAVFCFLDQPRPFAHYGWLAWPLALGVALSILRMLDTDSPAPRSAHHAALFLLTGVLGAWELHWWAVQETARHTAWSVTSVIVIPAVLVFLASSRPADRLWPVTAHAAAYRIGGVFTTLLAMGLWILWANATHDGRSDPLPYLPLLNAIDLGHGLVFACVAAAALGWRRSGLAIPEPYSGRGGWLALSVLVFVWLNAILLRSIHHWGDVPYRLDALMRSMLVQASLSIFWTLLALALMMYATRAGWRALWMAGAVLMGVVVVKLFLIDTSHIAGLERIVSFIAVGILMLVIGYFSPAPPRKREESS